jgi:AraC family transcriptional regulator
MARSHIAIVDPTHRRHLNLRPGTRFVWSSGSSWSGLILEKSVHESLDTPEFVIEDHCVVLHVSPVAAVEHKIQGVYCRFLRSPGNICLFSAGARRQLRTSDRHSVITLALSREFVDRALGRSDGARTLELREHLELRDGRIQHIVRALELDAEEGCPSGALYGESLGLALAVHLARTYSIRRLTLRDYKGGMAPKVLRRVVDYIESHLDDDLRLSALAAVAGLSPHRFAHNFKMTTGLSPHRYVTEQKIARAKSLLRESAMSVTEIGHALGYAQPSRFSTVFNRWAGTTPSAYRHASE